MKKLLKYTACLAMLVMVLALLTGCADKATGGGWFYTGCGEENKVTFGFNAQLVEEGVYKGQFQAKNHGTGEKFHMSEITFAFALGDFVGYFSGVDKDENKVKVTITDLGQPGAYIGDSIRIWNDEYGTWAGSLEGGNIQLHEEKD
jgi:hypothetical protein